jgi:hypothetical protein
MLHAYGTAITTLGREHAERMQRLHGVARFPPGADADRLLGERGHDLTLKATKRLELLPYLGLRAFQGREIGLLRHAARGDHRVALANSQWSIGPCCRLENASGRAAVIANAAEPSTAPIGSLDRETWLR